MNDLVFKFIIVRHMSLISSKSLVTNYFGLLSSKSQLEVLLGQHIPLFSKFNVFFVFFALFIKKKKKKVEPNIVGLLM